MENIKQIATLEDQETTITISYTDKMISVYTNRSTVMGRMLKKGFIPEEKFYLRGELEGMVFRIPMSKMGAILKKTVFSYGGAETVENEESEKEIISDVNYFNEVIIP